jgi:hypothetical protein
MFGARLGVYPKDATDSPWPTYLQHYRRSTVDHQIPANPNCSPPHSAAVIGMFAAIFLYWVTAKNNQLRGSLLHVFMRAVGFAEMSD